MDQQLDAEAITRQIIGLFPVPFTWWERLLSRYRQQTRLESEATLAYRKAILKGYQPDMEPWLRYLPPDSPRKAFLQAQIELLQPQPNCGLAAAKAEITAQFAPSFWAYWSASHLKRLAGEEEAARDLMKKAEGMRSRVDQAHRAVHRGLGSLSAERWVPANKWFRRAHRMDPVPLEHWAHRQLIFKTEKIAEVYDLCHKTSIVTHYAARFRYHSKVINPLLFESCRLWHQLTCGGFWITEPAQKRWRDLLHLLCIRIAEANFKEARDYRENEKNRSLHAWASVQNLLAASLLERGTVESESLIHNTCQRALDLVRKKDALIALQVLLVDYVTQSTPLKESLMRRVEDVAKEQHREALVDALAQMSPTSDKVLTTLANPSLPFSEQCEQLIGQT